MKLNEVLSPELYAQVQAEIDKRNEGQADKTKHIRFADLSEGGYVSVEKYNSQVNGLNQQVKDLQGQLSKRDTDITDLQGKLTAATADASKLVEVQTQLTGLQAQYTKDQQEWEAKTAKQRKEFMIREKANDLKFTSAAAKRDFLGQAGAKDFKLDGETLMGYEDFYTQYKSENPGAFVEEKPPASDPDNGGNGKKPAIVLPGNSGNSGGSQHGKSLEDLMKAKNANPDMVVSFGK